MANAAEIDRLLNLVELHLMLLLARRHVKRKNKFATAQVHRTLNRAFEATAKQLLPALRAAGFKTKRIPFNVPDMDALRKVLILAMDNSLPDNKNFREVANQMVEYFSRQGGRDRLDW